MAFLPDGQTMLVTERGAGGRLRILRRLVLDPQPVSGVPVADASIAKRQFEHLIAVAIHPKFAENMTRMSTSGTSRTSVLQPSSVPRSAATP